MNEPVNPQQDDTSLATADSGAPEKLVTASDYLPTLQRQYGSKAAAGKIVPTALDFLNGNMGGWPTGLNLLAGEPGIGKTAFALSNAAVAAQAGFSVLYLSFDLQSEFLVMKLLCQQAGLDSRALMDGALDKATLKAAVASHKKIFSRINVVEADPNLSIETAGEMARELIAASHRDRILVIVDYLQIWAAGTRQFSEFRHEIAKLMTAMRRLALNLNSPVLAMSSQNRAHRGEAVLESLEGTSDLEYSADSVSFLVNVELAVNKSSYTPPDGMMTKSRSISINLRKNRFGETGSRMIKFLPSTGTFDEESMRRPRAAE